MLREGLGKIDKDRLSIGEKVKIKDNKKRIKNSNTTNHNIQYHNNQ